VIGRWTNGLHCRLHAEYVSCGGGWGCQELFWKLSYPISEYFTSMLNKESVGQKVLVGGFSRADIQNARFLAFHALKI